MNLSIYLSPSWAIGCQDVPVPPQILYLEDGVQGNAWATLAVDPVVTSEVESLMGSTLTEDQKAAGRTTDMLMSSVDLALEEAKARNISVANVVVGLRAMMSGRAMPASVTPLSEQISSLGS